MVSEQEWLQKMVGKFSLVAELRAEKDLQLKLVESKLQRVLRKRSDFLTLKADGRRHHVCPWLLMVAKKNNEGYLRYGWTVSSYVGNSVIRNRIKRWTRTILREQIEARLEKSFDINFIFRATNKEAFKLIKFVDFKKCIEKALSRIE